MPISSLDNKIMRKKQYFYELYKKQKLVKHSTLKSIQTVEVRINELTFLIVAFLKRFLTFLLVYNSSDVNCLLIKMLIFLIKYTKTYYIHVTHVTSWTETSYLPNTIHRANSFFNFLSLIYRLIMWFIKTAQFSDISNSFFQNQFIQWNLWESLLRFLI